MFVSKLHFENITGHFILIIADLTAEPCYYYSDAREVTRASYFIASQLLWPLNKLLYSTS